MRQIPSHALLSKALGLLLRATRQPVHFRPLQQTQIFPNQPTCSSGSTLSIPTATQLSPSALNTPAIASALSNAPTSTQSSNQLQPTGLSSSSLRQGLTSWSNPPSWIERLGLDRFTHSPFQIPQMPQLPHMPQLPWNGWLGGGQQFRHLLMMPRRTKYRRAQKRLQYLGSVKSNTYQLSYGSYGIRATTGGVIRAATLEALRRTLRRKIKKSSKLWICVNASIPVSRKPAEVRMGKGKGAVKFWATRVRPGQVIFEMDRLPRPLALAAVEAIRHKTPVKVGFVEWN